MKKAIIATNTDLVDIAEGDVIGISMPDNLDDTRARYDGDSIVDIADYHNFYIDADGCKHIVQHNKEWQGLRCAWDDVLIQDKAGIWRVRTAEDALEDARLKAHKAIMDAANQQRSALTEKAEAAQLWSWQNKAQRAARVAADTATKADCEVLKAEAAARGKGETLAQLASKQTIKSEALMRALATLDGFESAALDALEEATEESVFITVCEQFTARLATFDAPTSVVPSAISLSTTSADSSNAVASTEQQRKVQALAAVLALEDADTQPLKAQAATQLRKLLAEKDGL